MTKFLAGVLEHITATLLLALISLLIVSLGIAHLEAGSEPKDWPTWIVIGVGLIVLLLSSLNGVRLAISRWHLRRLIRPATGERIALLLARFEGDTDDNSIRQTVRESITRELGTTIDIVLWPELIRVTEGHHEDLEVAARAQAQRWLKKKRCDILLWGRLKTTGVLSLRFTVLEQETTDPASYIMAGDTFEVSRNLISDLGSAVVASMLSSAKLARDRAGEYIVPRLRNAAERLKPIVTRLNPAFDVETRASLLHAYALIRSVLGSQTGSLVDLEEAIGMYRKALEELTRERFAAEWARNWGNMGAALARLGEITDDRKALSDATKGFRN